MGMQLTTVQITWDNGWKNSLILSTRGDIENLSIKFGFFGASEDEPGQ